MRPQCRSEVRYNAKHHSSIARKMLAHLRELVSAAQLRAANNLAQLFKPWCGRHHDCFSAASCSRMLLPMLLVSQSLAVHLSKRQHMHW